MPHSHLSCGACAPCRAGFDNACASIQVLGVQTAGNGGYAEYFTGPANLLIPLPDSVNFEQGAALLVNYGPVWTGLIERAQVEPGDTVLVTGATGGCGYAAIQIGRLAGARVLGLGGSDDKLAELEEAGAVPIDYRGGFAEKVSAATNGLGADIVLELVGAETWNEAIASAGLRGRIVVVGSHGGIRAELNLGLLFAMNLQIHGVTRANHGAMTKLVELAGRGELEPRIWRTLPLEEAAAAHRLMDERRHSGKIVLTVAVTRAGRRAMDSSYPLLCSCERNADRIALRTAGGPPVTYRELEARIAGLTAGLRGLGLAGATVGSVLLNEPETVELYMALARAGATGVPINTRLTEGERRYIVEDAGVTTIVAGDAFVAEALRLAERVPALTSVVSVRPTGAAPTSLHRLGGRRRTRRPRTPTATRRRRRRSSTRRARPASPRASCAATGRTSGTPSTRRWALRAPRATSSCSPCRPSASASCTSPCRRCSAERAWCSTPPSIRLAPGTCWRSTA